METLSSVEEQRLLEGVKEAVDLVDNQGKTPDEALAKVAQDFKWGRGQLRSAVSAFNNGRQVAQWEANDNLLDKLAEFPLADYDKIHDAIWGAKAAEKVASDRLGVSPEYSLPPSFVRDPYQEARRNLNIAPLMEKAAADKSTFETPAADPWIPARQAYHAHLREKRAYEDARSQFGRAHDTLRIKLRLLENYFQKSAYDRLAFPVFGTAIETYYGSAGRALVDTLAASFPREKRAVDACHVNPIDLHTAPFTYAKEAIEAGRQVCQCKTAMDAAYEKMSQAEENLRPFVQIPSTSHQESLPTYSLFDKQADMLVDSTKGMLSKALGGKAKSDIQDMTLDLEDPEHENELRKIRSQVILNNMMSDPENPISGHDPDEVLNAFNQISTLAPRVATQPMALQTALAKKLSGNMEPFEINELNNIEKGIRVTHGSPLSVGLLGTQPFDPEDQE